MSKIPKNNQALFILLLIFLYALGSHLYFVFRYSGRWVEWDSDFMVKLFQAVYEQGTYATPDITYPHGFGTQVIAVFILNILNVSAQDYALFLHPIITTVYVFIAYLLFLEFTKDYRIALLSTFLLSLQPEFFWTSTRNTHEGFIYLLVLTAMFAFSKSFAKNIDFHKLVSFIIIFYISFFAMISYNVFFASSFVFTITFVCLIGNILSKKFSAYLNFRRMVFSSSICIILVFTFMFYIYPPAGLFFSGAMTFINKIANLFFIIEEHSTPQYSYITEMWTSPYIWLFLTLFNWIIALLSFIMALKLLKGFINKRNIIEYTHSLVILLIAYTAFSLLLIVYIIADRFGQFTSNLELRIFPILIIFAVPLASMYIFEILDSKGLSSQKKIYFRIFLVILLILFVGNSLIKGTNDPLVSNKWIFYSEQEGYGIKWVDNNLHGKSIWADLDERLLNLFNLQTDFKSYKKVAFVDPKKGDYYFISDIIEKRASRVNFTIPSTDKSDIIYNSKNVKIFKI